MKDNIILLIASIILAFAVFNSVTDENEMHHHEDFFEEVRKFMNKGKRFSSDDGYSMCISINELEARSGIKQTDCREYLR